MEWLRFAQTATMQQHRNEHVADIHPLVQQPRLRLAANRETLRD